MEPIHLKWCIPLNVLNDNYIHIRFHHDASILSNAMVSMDLEMNLQNGLMIHKQILFKYWDSTVGAGPTGYPARKGEDLV